MVKGTIMANIKMAKATQFLLFGAARFCFYFSYHAPLTLLSRLGRFLFFLVAAGFLSVVLTACAGGGGGGSSGDGGPVNNSSMDGNGPGNGAMVLGVFNASLTFAPIRGGFQIGSQSDFSSFTSLKITATSGSEVVERSINIDEFANDSYDFTGLADRDWKFQITGILSDSREQEVNIVFVWPENHDDHAGDGIRSGLDTDGDRRADSVDDNDDNDAYLDDVDVDDDGDGLIEIRTHEELNAVRHQLDGSGRKLLDTGAADTTGCGGTGGITSCSGYELVDNISLADYVDYDSGKGWQPLGQDTDRVARGCQGTAFSGTFEGNGFMISNLSISRSGEDCVGLFGHLAPGATIRNLILRAEAVIGKFGVGGLVGDGNSARIVSSSVVAAEVSGSSTIGGLVGDGSNARIYSSSVVAAEVRASDVAGIYSGGLVGFGQNASIFSSSAIAAQVSGQSSTGGLVGAGLGARIHSSSVVVGEVRGGIPTGGLVGDFAAGRVAYSYMVSGSATMPLVGQGSGTGVASYWDSDTSGVTNGNHGEAKTTSDLRSPTNYTDIYATWDDNTDLFGDGNVPLAVWCDEDNSGSIESDEQTPGNLIWNFGTSSQYPAIRCTPLAPDDWRDWWSLNASGKPELDRARLDDLLQ